MKYLSEIIHYHDFEKLSPDTDYLFISNTGTGKTHLTLDKFVAWAHTKNKKVLYLYNRNSMKIQFGDYYENKHSNLKTLSYQHLEKKYADDISTICCFDLDKLNEFHFILCDECHYFASDSLYNKETYVSFETINNSKATKIFFTATPKLFYKISTFLNRGFKEINFSSFGSKPIQNIYLCKSSLFNASEKYFIKNNKILHFENNKSNNDDLCDYFDDKGYETLAVSKENIGECTDVLLKNKSGLVEYDYLASTSVCETGINFNYASNIIITFPQFLNWTSFEQSVARVRQNSYEISVLYAVPKINKLSNSLEFYKEKLLYYKSMHSEVIKYSDFSHCKTNYLFIKVMIENIINEISQILDFYWENDKNILPYLISKLKSIYPNANIIHLDPLDVIDAKGYFDTLMSDNTELTVDMKTIEKIKEDLNIGPQKIKRKLKGYYLITPTRKTKDGYKETYWVIKKLQK